MWTNDIKWDEIWLSHVFLRQQQTAYLRDRCYISSDTATGIVVTFGKIPVQPVIWIFRFLCVDQFESSTSPPGQPPGHLNFWRLARSNSPPPSGQKSRSNAPPISTELPLLKDKVKFVFNQTLDTPFRERDAVTGTFKLVLKTLLKELFINKGEILFCKSVKPCKNRKSSRAYFVRTRLIRFKFPTLPTQHSNSPPRARGTVKCLGYARGDVEVSNWSAH